MSSEITKVGSTALTTAMFLFAICTGVLGMPPYPGDASRPGYAAKAKSFERSYALMHSILEERGIDQPADIDFPAWLASTPTASKNMLCILIEFPDQASITDAAFFDTLIYDNQPGSVRHYYSEVSYGQLDIVAVDMPSTLGWVTAQNDYNYYTNGFYGLGGYPQNCQKLVEEAVDLVDAQVNFADYDNDGDGFVDGLMVVHSGKGAELSHSADDIWSHKWGIMPRLRDGTFVSSYSMMPEYWFESGDMTHGVFCHELGHVFGLPDLYDRDYSSSGIGRWSLMASGSWNGYLGDSPAHLDAWSRVRLGFASYTNITGSAYGTHIADVESSGEIYRLWTNGALGNEYFLIENRRKKGYDTGLPGEGLLIWHIDDNVFHNDNEWYPGYTGSGHYAVALIQADDNWSLEMGLGQGDSGDPYPGGTGNAAFTPFSSPNSNDYDGQSSLVGIVDITSSGDTIIADLFVSFSLGADDTGSETAVPGAFALSQNFPNPFNSETQIVYSLERSCEIRMEIFNALGQSILALNRHAVRGTHSFTWDGTDASGSEMPSGTYFYKLTADSQSQVRKMIFLK